MAATAARGQFGDGSTPKFVHYILVYICAKIGAFIKKCTIGLNILGKPPDDDLREPLRMADCDRASGYLYKYFPDFEGEH